jgi:hypothetical protein
MNDYPSLDGLIHLISIITDSNLKGKRLDLACLTKNETRKLLEYLKELQQLKL